MENEASNNHVQCSIELVEPVLFQKGFNLGGQSSADQEQEAILRGKLVLRITKPVKLKAVRLDFTGRSRTERQRGSLQETYGQLEEKTFIKHSWFFFDTRRSYLPRRPEKYIHEDGGTIVGLGISPICGVYTPLRPPPIQSDSDSNNTDLNLDQHTVDQKYLPSQSSRFWKRTAAQRPGYQLFEPGIYEYCFEFPIPQTCPETVRIGGRYVNYQLEAIVKLKSVLTANIHNTKDVVLLRVPDLDSVDQAGPIVIDKTWEDRLHYNLAISSKSFSVGSKIPITLRLASSKIRCHSLRVYLTENVQFFGQEGSSYRRAPQRKIKLLEKSMESRSLGGFGDVAMDSLVQKPKGSAQAPGTAEAVESEKRGMAITLEDTKGLDFEHGPIKIELQVQLPSCRSMRESGPAQQINLDTHWDSVDVSHWINVVLSLHKSEPDGPTEAKCQCYDLSIDSPIRILSCYATLSNTLLPAYSNTHDATAARIFECGCPDAVSKNDSQITQPAVIIPDIINMRQHTANQDMRISRFQSSASHSQSGDVRDLESESQRPTPQPTPFLLLPPVYSSAVEAHSNDVLNSDSTRTLPPEYSDMTDEGFEHE